MKSRVLTASLLLALPLFCGLVAPALAQTFTYTTGTTGNWSTNAWSGGTVPSPGGGSGYQLVFSNSGNSSYNLTYTDNFGTGTFDLNSLTLNGNESFNIASSGTTPDVLTFVSNGGTSPTINQNDTLVGGSTISSAILISNALTIDGTGADALTLSGGITNTAGMTINDTGGGKISTGTLMNTGGIILASTDTSILALSSTAITSGSGGITINGGEALLSTATDNYTFSGGITLNGGTLELSLTNSSDSEYFGAGTVALNSGTLLVGTTANGAWIENAIQLGGNVIIVSTGGTGGNSTNQVGNTGAVTLSANSTLTSYYSFQLGRGTTIDLKGYSLTVNEANSAVDDTLVLNSMVDTGGTGSLTIASTGTGTVQTGSIVDDGGVTISDAGNYTGIGVNLAGAISGAGGLTISSTGTAGIKLGVANTYSGGTTVSDGLAEIAAASSGSAGAPSSGVFGTGTVTMTGVTIESYSATAYSIYNAVSLNGNVTLGSATNTGALTFSGPWTVAGASTITANSAVTIGSASQAITNNFGLTVAPASGVTVTFAGAIGGSSALGVNGAGTVLLSVANSYTGGTILTSGTLTTGVAGTLGTANVIVAASPSAILTLGNASSISQTSGLSFGTGSEINLNFTGTDTIYALFDSSTDVSAAAGTYSDTALNTLFGTTIFTGTGDLDVLNAAAVPEPSTWTLLFSGFTLYALITVARRRSQTAIVSI